MIIVICIKNANVVFIFYCLSYGFCTVPIRILKLQMNLNLWFFLLIEFYWILLFQKYLNVLCNILASKIVSITEEVPFFSRISKYVFSSLLISRCFWCFHCLWYFLSNKWNKCHLYNVSERLKFWMTHYLMYHISKCTVQRPLSQQWKFHNALTFLRLIAV